MTDYKNYIILCYEVRYRRDVFEEWNKEHFSDEESAFDFFCTVLRNKRECQMLKIEALESWCRSASNEA